MRVLCVIIWYTTTATPQRLDTHSVWTTVENRGVTVSFISRCLMPKCGRERLVYVCLKLHDFGHVISRLNRLRIEGLKLTDAILQPLNATAQLIDGQDGAFGRRRSAAGHGSDSDSGWWPRYYPKNFQTYGAAGLIDRLPGLRLPYPDRPRGGGE